MFTGIIQALGQVAEIMQTGGDLRLYIRTQQLDISDVQLGDSIATNGVCLTVVELPGDGFWADVSKESLANTRLVDFKPGQQVNLEKALRPVDRLGGHIVTGHVDGVGTLRERWDDARSIRLLIEAPAALAPYIAAKGSITLDGVSLTVNRVEGCSFLLNVVPHTAQVTLIAHYRPGDQVHLEVDIIARYLERLMHYREAPDTGVTLSKLAEHGFIKRN